MTARLITGALKYHHVTPILQDLPIIHGVKYNTVLIVYKALNCLAPYYINDMFALFELFCTFRSSGHNLLWAPLQHQTPVTLPSFDSHLFKALVRTVCIS